MTAGARKPLAPPRSLDPAMHSCDDCAVRDHALCAALEASELRELSAMGRRRSLRAGESLIWEGDDSMLVGNVIEGVLKLSTSTSDGREQIVGVVQPATSSVARSAALRAIPSPR